MPFIVMEPGGSRSCHTVEKASEALALKANLQVRRAASTVVVFRLEPMEDAELSELAADEGRADDGSSFEAAAR